MAATHAGEPEAASQESAVPPPTFETVGSAAEGLGQGDEERPMYSLESLCMRCGEQGTTRLLLTKIPHFREIVVMAFDCPHCGEHNNEVQFAGALQPTGLKMTLTVPLDSPATLNRQIVKSDSASIRIPELDFDIPPETQKGSLSTVEGVLSRAADELGALQEGRRKADPAAAEKIDAFLARLRLCASGKEPFTLVLDDPAGNSFVENPLAPAQDPQLKVEHYERTAEDCEKLGFSAGVPAAQGSDTATQAAEAVAEASGEHLRSQEGAVLGVSSTAKDAHKYVPAGTVRRPSPHGAVGAPAMHNAIASECSPEQAQSLLGYAAPEEVMTFPAHCSACSVPSETRMYVTSIPYFKEVVIMSTACDSCGFRSSELKAGGPISAKGKRICLVVKDVKDLTRDVIKSDSAAVFIPEIELELTPGTLGGRVTTVEGLVSDIESNLAKIFPFQMGDSAVDWEKSKWLAVQRHLRELLQMNSVWHLILDDALANSFIAPRTGESMVEDPQLEVEEYTRTWEQDEDLGLHDMNTGEAEDGPGKEVEEEKEGNGNDLELGKDVAHDKATIQRV